MGHHLSHDASSRTDWDKLALVVATMQCGPATMRQLARDTGLGYKVIQGRIARLRDLGHHIYGEKAHNSTWYHYLRPPGKYPCPDCGYMLRSTQPHYICDCCRDKRINDGQDIWPSVRELT